MPTESKSNILAAAEKAYKKVAKDWNIPTGEVHRRESCREVSDIILRDLLIEGDESWDMVERSHYGLPAGSHAYLVRDDPEGEIILDSTWQQFLKPEQWSDEMPKVLIGKREEVEAQARAFGIDSRVVMELWRPYHQLGYRPEERWRYSKHKNHPKNIGKWDWLHIDREE